VFLFEKECRLLSINFVQSCTKIFDTFLIGGSILFLLFLSFLLSFLLFLFFNLFLAIKTMFSGGLDHGDLPRDSGDGGF
jgi:hypothetical protein